MPDLRRRNCRHCGRSDSEVGPISWGGNCSDCGRARAIQAADELHYHGGPMFDHWRARIAASVGAVLPEQSQDAA